MRPGPTFDVTAAPAPAVAGGRGGGGSPVAYLFGGLAAMVGLIGFALLILACSYWKVSSFLEDGGSGDGGGGGEEDMHVIKERAHPGAEYGEQVVVIMAGDEKPTYIATPMMSRPACALGDRMCNKGGMGDGGDEQESKVNGNETQRKELNQSSCASQNLEV